MSSWASSFRPSRLTANQYRSLSGFAARTTYRTMERAMRNPTSSIRKVGWLRRRTEALQLQLSSNHPPPRSTRYVFAAHVVNPLAGVAAMPGDLVELPVPRAGRAGTACVLPLGLAR